MQIPFRAVTLFCTLFCLVFTAFSTAQARPVRVAYVECGTYADYAVSLAAMSRRLKELGVIENGDVPLPQDSDTAVMWQWLREHAGGDTLEFLQDGHYTWHMREKEGIIVVPALLKRIQEQKDIDMLWVLGVAGSFIIKGDFPIPVFSLDVNDPVALGISKTYEHSGKRNVHAQCMTDIIKQHLTMFQKIFNFRKMGIIEEKSTTFQQYSAIGSLERAAQQLNIELVRCTAPLTGKTDQEITANLTQCMRQLAPQVEAVYVQNISATVLPELKHILQPLADAGIPTFSQCGITETRYGVLMSLSQHSEVEGRFAAEAVAKVLAGARPEDVPQIFPCPLTLTLNLAMAEKIKWQPSAEILANVDKVFYTMSPTDE